MAEIAQWEADGRNLSDPYGYCKLANRPGSSLSFVMLENMAVAEVANTCQYANEQGDTFLGGEWPDGLSFH